MMRSLDSFIDGVKTGGKFRGKTELLKHLSGERLTQRQAILATCYDCQGHYSDGAADCLSGVCPLRPFMPYRNKSKAEKQREIP
jgi:hypothetical protein